MPPLALAGLGTSELLIILAVVVLLFGGSRLAGLGKSSGRAIREFKEETTTPERIIEKPDALRAAEHGAAEAQPESNPTDRSERWPTP